MLARLVYRMLRHGEQYVDNGMKYYEEKYREHEIRAFRKRPRISASSLLSPPPLFADKGKFLRRSHI
jgi:hypothetical protein